MLRHPPAAPPAQAGPVTWLAGLGFDALTEAQVVAHVVTASKAGMGGWVITPNIDICRLARRDAALRDLVARASLVVADGMPLIWAAKLRGEPLPERVTGASLIFSLSAAAAAHGSSVYLLGGEPGVPEQAATELARQYPGLVVAGTDAPPVGFDADPQAVAAVHDRLAAAAPDIVYVGLGFPKQERLIERLAPAFPGVWFIGCGAAIPFAAKALPRAPQWMQRSGLEWLFRLISEPRRLFRRYLVHDLPFALRLLSAAAVARLRPRRGPDGRAAAAIPLPRIAEDAVEMASKLPVSAVPMLTGRPEPATVSNLQHEPGPEPALPVTPGPAATSSGAAPAWPGAAM